MYRSQAGMIMARLGHQSSSRLRQPMRSVALSASESTFAFHRKFLGLYPSALAQIVVKWLYFYKYSVLFIPKLCFCGGKCSWLFILNVYLSCFNLSALINDYDKIMLWCSWNVRNNFFSFWFSKLCDKNYKHLTTVYKKNKIIFNFDTWYHFYYNIL